MGKEYRVQLHTHENDNYHELWKVIDEDKYFLRNTFNNEGTWYTVCDPLGYCECDSRVKDDITFILCDSEGNEVCRYSNAEPNPLPKLETVIKTEWDEFVKKTQLQHNTEDYSKNFWAMCWNGQTTLSLDQWLLSFCDPDLYPEIKQDCCIDHNWVGCWHNTETEWTPLLGSEFKYLNQEYYFVKVHHVHDTCKVEWDTFECCPKPYEMGWWSSESHPQVESIMLMGNWFDASKHGTMYSAREAENKVIAALLKVFPKEKAYSRLLFVRLGDRTQKYWRDTCEELDYGKVAERLLHYDYHRKFVDELCKSMKGNASNVRKQVFPCNLESKKRIKEKYPDIYGYDYCLI